MTARPSRSRRIRGIYGDDFITMFDFEPALRCIVDEIRNRVIKRLRTELGIDVTELKK